MRSHDLNRLLDEPGSDHNGVSLLKISFPVAPAARGLGVANPDGADDSGHHCNGALPKRGILCDQISRVLRFLAEPSRSTRWALVRVMTARLNCSDLPHDPHAPGSVTDGKIRRLTMSIGAPQQLHSSCARGVVMDGLTDSLNTTSLSSAIRRLLLGCKKPFVILYLRMANDGLN